MKPTLLLTGILCIGMIPSVSANNIFGTYDRNDVIINQYRSGWFEIKAKDRSFEVEYKASGAFEIELNKNKRDYQDIEYYASGAYELDLEHEGKQETKANFTSHKNSTLYNYLNASDIAQIERDVKAMLTANPIVVKDLKSYLTPLSNVSTLPAPNPPVVSNMQKQKDALSQKWRNIEPTLNKLDSKKRDDILNNFINRIDTMLRNASGDARLLLEHLRELARNSLSTDSIDSLFNDLLKDIDNAR